MGSRRRREKHQPRQPVPPRVKFRGRDSQQRAALCQAGAEVSGGGDWEDEHQPPKAWISTQCGPRPCPTQFNSHSVTGGSAIVAGLEPTASKVGVCMVSVSGSRGQARRSSELGPALPALLVELNIEQGDTVARQKREVL